jgi:hypothetical protein
MNNNKGLLFNGFGLHSYYLQRTGTTFNYLPWARTKAIASTFGKYLAITLPFFCITINNLDLK